MMDLSIKHNDIDIINGDLSLCLTDKEAIAQAIIMRLKTLAGEWFLNSRVGIPYLIEVFGHKLSPSFLELLIASEIKNTPGVGELTDFKIHINNDRTAHISFSASLSDGSSISIDESIGL